MNEASITKRLLSKVSKVKTAVKVEKASASPEGVAKVLFSINAPVAKRKALAANASAMEAAFGEILGSKARILPKTIHAAEVAGFYYGFIKSNTPVIEEQDAAKEGSGYHLVAANVFADEGDNIWEVKESAGKRILVRNNSEDLSELFDQIAPRDNMSLSAASIHINDNLEFASIVTFIDAASGEYHNGVMLDTATVYDFTAKAARGVSPALAIASSGRVSEIVSELNTRYGNDVSTFKELADANVQDVYDYLDTLYQNNPVFLAAYKDAVRRLIDLPRAA